MLVEAMLGHASLNMDTDYPYVTIHAFDDAERLDMRGDRGVSLQGYDRLVTCVCQSCLPLTRHLSSFETGQKAA